MSRTHINTNDNYRQRIMQQQHVLDYQKHQQELDLKRIHEYQLRLDSFKHNQQIQQEFLRLQQAEIDSLEVEQERLLKTKLKEIQEVSR